MTELTQLGAKVSIPDSPDKAVLEFIPFSGQPIVVRYQVPEWTGLCPVTGQPDFGRFVIDYVPKLSLIESKSLKLFMASFRNHGAFHEEVTTTIGNTLFFEANPIWIRVCGFFSPRGNIPIDVFYQRGEKPVTLYIPDPDLNAYRLR